MMSEICKKNIVISLIIKWIKEDGVHIIKNRSLVELKKKKKK